MLKDLTDSPIEKPKSTQRKPAPAPVQKAIDSAAEEFWTLRNIPEDVRRMVGRAIRENGGDKKYWVTECIRFALYSKYGGKKDNASKLSL
jgi:hypothetical protein